MTVKHTSEYAKKLKCPQEVRGWKNTISHFLATNLHQEFVKKRKKEKIIIINKYISQRL